MALRKIVWKMSDAMQQSKLNIKTEIAPDFAGLKAAGYTIRELFLDGYFDGFSATKTVKDKTVEVYVGSDDGHVYFTPIALVDECYIGEAATPEKAARMAEIGAMFRGQKSNASMQHA